jgi:DNA-binding MarR family transcriptional regulator
MSKVNEGLQEKFIRFQWLLHKRHLRDFANDGPMANPSRGQGRILALLKTQDGISTKDMSYLLDIRISSLNELLSKLEKNGYIERKPSQEDKRIILVNLTEKGRNEKLQKSSSGIFGCLSHDERENLEKYLDKLIGALEEQVGDEDDDERIEALKAMHERLGEGKFMKFAHLIKHRGSLFGKRFAKDFQKGDFSGHWGAWHGANKDDDNE